MCKSSVSVIEARLRICCWVLPLVLLLLNTGAGAEGIKVSEQLEPVVLQLKWKHQFQFAGYYAALEKGFYRQAGLDVQIREHSGDRSPIDVMLEGDAQFVVSSANALIKRAQGYPIVALAAIYQHSPYALLVRADSGINSVSELEGKRIMLGEGVQDAALHAMLEQGGLEATEFYRLDTNFDAKSLIRGETDAFNAYVTDQGFLLRQAGVEPHYIMPKDYGIDFYGDVLVTTESELEAQPLRVEAFRLATLKGWSYALNHIEEMVDLILQKYNTQQMTREHLLFEATMSQELIQPLFVEIGYMNPERWEHIKSIFVGLGFIGPNSQIDGMLYEDYRRLPGWLVWLNRHFMLLLFCVIGVMVLSLLAVIAHMRRLVRIRTGALIESSHHYRTVFDAAPEGMWLIDPSRKTVDVNKRLMALLGYSKNEMLGKTPLEFVDAMNREVFIEQTSKIGTTERRSYDIELRHKDGHNIPTHFSAVTLRGKDGTVKAAIAFVEDITERKRMEAELRSSEQNLRRLIDAEPACVSTLDKRAELLSINPAGLEMLEAEGLSQLSEATLNEVVDAPYREAFKRLNSQVFSGQRGVLTFSITGLKGRKAWLETHAVPITDADGKVVEHLGLTHDVTDRLQMEQQIMEEREFLQRVIDNIGDSVMVIDRELRIQLMNQSVKSHLKEFQADPGKMTHYFDLPFVSAPSEGNLIQDCPVHQVLQTGKQATAILTRPQSMDPASVSKVEVVASPLLNPDGSLRAVIEVARDITEHLDLLEEVKQQKDDLQHIAHHDSLTNLPNRSLFLLRLKQAISKAKRTGLQMAVLFVDLDRFKEINDSLGHAFGDRVLKLVSERFKQSVREDDTIARLGGDEFTFILEGLNRPQHAAKMAQQIIHSLELPIEVDHHQLYLTTSIGISVYPQDGKSAETMLRNADAAMYKAKDEGKNTFQYYTEDMTEQAFERIFLEASLRRALGQNELAVCYQPQVDTRSGNIIGVEVLVRWLHPEMGTVLPSRFISLAEDTGLIIPLGEQVMRIACKQMAEWDRQGIRPGRIAINLSGKQVSSRELLTSLQSILAETGCRPEWLEFEVTEGFLMKDPEKAVSILQQVRDLGIELAIDDFGTGYSSLTYLKRFPLTRLKIDQSFIRDVPHDQEDVAITRAIIALGNSLNLQVLAEGVESEEQKRFLIGEGCSEAQGYYFCHPLTVDKMTYLLMTSRQLPVEQVG
ncbi:MAG: EAL domain-containing protein [Candidatus Thiodiazotropha endolucinida]|nr:EAL domain-containing protein [Candidatus Thiodiazotropha endolucinida]